MIRGQFLADQDLVKPPAGVRGALARFLEGLTENEWIALVVLWFWSAVGCLWLRWMMERPLARLLSLYGFLTAGFLFVCAGGLCAVKLGENRPETRAIVLAAELAVQQSPGGREDTLFRLHAGSPVRVEDRRGGWLFIRLPNGAAGWAPEDALGFVRPRDRKRAEEFLLKTQTMTGKEH
ncbi:hypothetical protein HS125_02390 [bacterium]|nr:hypothetical protein [bacterium]